MAMKTTIIGVILLLIGLLAGCNSINSNKGVSDEAFKYDYDLASSLGKKHLDALVLDSADRHCVDKVNEFAFSLLHQIVIDMDSSFVVAPLSLASAIAVAGNGAAGKTLEEIEQVVGPIADANAFFKKYEAALPHNDYTDCSLLNYMAVNEICPVEDSFSKSVSANYDACIKNHDFSSAKSARKINDWFSKELQDNSISVIDDLDPMSLLYLINALDFNALWRPLNKEDTFIDDFVTDNGDTLKIPLMHDNDDYAPYISYFETSDYKAITVPYLGSCFKMLFVMPKTEKLATFCQSMTHESFNEMINSFPDPVELLFLKLPRFRCDCDLDLGHLIKGIIPSAFSNSADFRNISAIPSRLDDINQKTRIEVNEQGTKARSITLESVVVLCDRPEFYAQHPFLYFVYDDATRAILLMGQFCGDGAIF